MSISFEDAEKRLTVIVGAGASYDCGALSEADSTWRPPLAKDLFLNRYPSFTDVLRQYPGAENLADEIRGGLARGMNLEAILRVLSESTNLGTKRDFLQVPLYIQHLIGDVSANYIKSGGTSFSTLVRAIDQSSYTKVLYLTTNYDLFLDRALERHHRFTFGSMSDYLRTGNSWQLVKLHGSVNWGHRLLNSQSSSEDPVTVLNELEIEDLRFGPIELRGGYKDGHRFRRTAGGISEFSYPALAVPIEKKDEFVCPSDHAETAKWFLGRCTDFLVLGFSGLDAHVLKLLHDVTFVNRFLVANANSQDAEQTMARICAVNPLFNHSSYEPRAYERAFSDFMQQGQLTNFLTASNTVGA